MALLTITEPAEEPASLDELKDFLRVDVSDTTNDGVISSLAGAARKWAEVYTRRRFVTQTMRLMMDFFPGYSSVSPFVPGQLLFGAGYAIVLPCPPVTSISVFSYVDGNGAVQSMAGAYVADLASQPARLTPIFGSCWPVSRMIPNAVTVDYICGYGAAIDVPEGIKTGIKMLANYWYENRIPDQSNIPAAVKAVLGPYRDLRF